MFDIILNTSNIIVHIKYRALFNIQCPLVYKKNRKNSIQNPQ